MTSAKDQRTMSRVAIPDPLHDALKIYAEENNMSLKEAQDAAITWFIAFKRKQGASLYYLASPTNSEYKSMWVDSKVHEKAKRQASTDNSTLGRLIFSAFVYFLKDKGQIP